MFSTNRFHIFRLSICLHLEEDGMCDSHGYGGGIEEDAMKLKETGSVK